jgi:2-polyprenyl-6-methoxyphenol hydroxylase-like FAD-dependent oxidoreductase
MYDVIVIGARCAGASTAMLLARKGYRVLILDRARFPSDLPQGHFIHQQGPARLQRWGLLEAIKASGCPGVESCTYDIGDFPLTGVGLVRDGVAVGYGPRRKVLDQILLDAAVNAGAELREACAVEGFLSDGERIVGVRGRGPNGTLFTEHAAITVGADGRNSRLAQTVHAPVYEDVPTLMCYSFSYWSGVELRALCVYARGDRALFGFPTHDGLFAVFHGAPISELRLMRANIESHFTASLARAPSLAEHLRAGRREERFYGAADLPNFFRKPYGPGWALVGDAGHHKDPYLALGVSDALRDAELLSDALAEALSGQSPFDVALARYESRRNEAARPMYRETLDCARFAPVPAQAYELRAALRSNPEDTRHFFMARFGLMPRESFFNSQNIQRVLQAAGAPSGPLPLSKDSGERIPMNNAT